MPRVPPATGRIKKGEARNPKGSSAKARTLAKIRRLTADQLAEVTSVLLTGHRDNLSKIGADPDATFLQVWTAKLLAESFKKGDIAIYKAILDRVVGLPKQTVALGGDAESGPMRIETQTREEKEARLERLRLARLGK